MSEIAPWRASSPIRNTDRIMEGLASRSPTLATSTASSLSIVHRALKS